MSRIFAISDLHTDYEANMEFVESLPPHPEDVLIVAGDVSDDIPRYATGELNFQFYHFYELYISHSEVNTIRIGFYSWIVLNI